MKLVCVGLLVFFSCREEAPAPPVIVCPPVAEWSATYQKQLRDEVAALPPGAAARVAIRQHIQMRKRARVCQTRLPN